MFSTYGGKIQKDEIKAECIIPYEEQEDEEKYGGELEIPPKLATRERAEEERSEEEIEYLQALIEEKWKKAKIPKLDRIHFKRLFFFQESSLGALRH